MLKIFYKILLTGVLGLLCVPSCNKNEVATETILARVGDKTISLNEFLRRAEYTIRPRYCSNNTNVDKKIILNSLIAEKLFSLEAERKYGLMNKQNIKTYLQGRKEQAMRQILYKKEVTDNVKLDNKLIQTTGKYASREYDVSYISLSDTIVVKQLEEEFFDLKYDWERNLTENYNLKEIPSKKVIWSNAENFKMLDLLFTQEHRKGTIIGPVKFSDNHFMFLKINGWKETKIITEAQQNQYLKNIKDVYTQRESRIIFENYIKKIMKGKKIEFNEKVFLALADIMGPVYMKSQEEREEILKKGLWEYNKEQQKYRELKPRIEEIKKEILFTLNEEDFLVEDFLKELKVHPLVFREKNFSHKDFGFQLQMAIIDQVRDKYLTEEAYSQNLDKATEVLRNDYMWYDYLNAVSYKYEFLKDGNADSLSFEDNLRTIQTILNPHVDSLQNKYKDQTTINAELFNSIQLSRVDMAVTYSNAPFSMVVPSFPMITTDYKLDYGKSDNNLK